MLACDSGDSAPGDGDGDGDGDGRFAAQVISPACAPNGGPALRLTLAAAIDPQSCAATDLEESLVITVYSREIAPPETFDVAELSEGDAFHCPGGDAPCLTARSGSVTFETYDPDVAAAGSYVVDLGSEVIDESFDAEACEPDPPVFCL